MGESGVETTTMVSPSETDPAAASSSSVPPVACDAPSRVAPAVHGDWPYGSQVLLFCKICKRCQLQNVVIIGGGPGGATLGCYLAQLGIRATLFEAAKHPRPHVGESMVPSTTRIFSEIGFLSTVEESGFVRKYGASWHPPSRHGEVFIEFREFPQEGVDQDHTYHVDRARFDHLLFQHAASLGVEVHENARVKEVLMDGDRACGVRVEIAGEVREVSADIVVDASGRRALLGRQLGLMEKDKQFDQFALHAWFTGVERSEHHRESDIHIYFLPVERGWVWQIPITEEITSIGVVVDRKVFRTMDGDLEGWFDEMVATSPDVASAMANAVRIRDFQREGDYSYRMRQFTGPGYVLIGDAARFVDPIFSSGVSVAMHSAKFAAEAIKAHFLDGAPADEVFPRYEKRIQRGCQIWYEFICSYYRLLPLFTLFIQDERYRLEILQLLQGDVYDREEVAVLDAMREFISSVENNENHLMRRYLGNVEMADVAH